MEHSVVEGLLCTSMLSTSCSTFFVGVYTEVNLPCVDMLAGVPAHQLICVAWYSRVFIGFLCYSFSQTSMNTSMLLYSLSTSTVVIT